MQCFDFAAFMEEYRLSGTDAAKVFGVSRRTVIRWRKHSQVPGPAARLARTIQRRSPPWNHSFWRGSGVGAVLLPLSWRVVLFGENWREEIAKLDRPRIEQARREYAAAAAAIRAAEEEARRERARRAAETRRMRAAGRLSAGGNVHDLRPRPKAPPATPQEAPQHRMKGSRWWSAG